MRIILTTNRFCKQYSIPPCTYFVPVFAAAWVAAGLNFIWMVIVARRWKLPDGRTSLQAYRDQQR
jgi:hypothetical protein